MKKTKRWLYPVILVILISLAAGVYMKQQAASKAVEPPSCGYDVTVDSRGYYNAKVIFPFEREVFNAVVREMRENPPSYNVSSLDIDPIDDANPQEEAYNSVAPKYDLDADTVRQIYIKVASQLASVSKQGGLKR